MPPRLRFADRFAARAGWREHLEEENPKRGLHSEQTLTTIGALLGPLQSSGWELFFEHALKFTKVFHLGCFSMCSASKKQWSKCGKEWCFKAHAASLIHLDPLSLVLLSQKRFFIHFRPYLSAIRVCMEKCNAPMCWQQHGGA